MRAAIRQELDQAREHIERRWFWISATILAVGIVAWVSLPLAATFILITQGCVAS